MSRDRFTASSYHLMTAAEKQAASMARAREQPVACLNCDTQVMPSDFSAHVKQRCHGPRDPGPADKWIGYQEAVAIVPERTFVRWVDKGRVRFRGGRGDRRYLHRDLVQNLNVERFRRRR